MGDINENKGDNFTEKSTDAINIDEVTSEDVGVKYKQFGDPVTSGDDEDKPDFGTELLVKGKTAEEVSNFYGTNAELKSKEFYWKDKTFRDNLTAVYDDDPEKTAKAYDVIYETLKGEFSRYKQENFETERYMRSLAGTSATGKINENKTYTNSFNILDGLKTGGVEFDGEIYGKGISERKADNGKIRIVSLDEEGNPSYTFVDADPNTVEMISRMDGVEGFAYDKFSPLRGEGYMDIVINNQIWDSEKNTYVDVKEHNHVSNFDLMPDDSILGRVWGGNGIEMDGAMEYLSLFPRTATNLAINLLTTPAELMRGILAARYGEDVSNNSIYKHLTKVHNKASGWKTSSTDEARKDGFYGSFEVVASTIGDVVAQVWAAGAIGKLAQLGARPLLATKLAETSSIFKGTVETISSNAVRGVLTGMASGSFYQEAIDSGFTKRQAGIGMGLVTLAMWKANSLSEKMLKGVDPVKAEKMAAKAVRRKARELANAITPGVNKADDAFRMFGRTMNFGKTINGLMEKGSNLYYKNDMTFAFFSEASEEIFEDTGQESVRQLMNGYVAFRGKDFALTEVGDGRFKSMFDKGYWPEFFKNLSISGIAGGVGGPMGKMMHGSGPISNLTRDSGFLEFHLAEQSELLDAAIEKSFKENTLAPEGLTPEINDKTGAFIAGGGKTMNEYIRDMLKAESIMARVFVKTSGLAELKADLESDPLLKGHLKNTTAIADVKNIAIELRELLNVTGLGTDILETLNNEDIDATLLKIGESKASRRAELQRQVEKFELEISKLEVKKEEAAKAEDKKAQEEIDKELEKAKKDQEANQTASDKANLSEMVDDDDLNRIKELVRQIRGIQSGFAIETYLLQHLFRNDRVFGAKHLRDKEFMNYNANLLRESFEDTRNTINDIKLRAVRNIQKSDDNSKRLLSTNKDNLDDIVDIFQDSPFMTKEAYDHIAEIYADLSSDPEVLQPIFDYVSGQEYFDKSMAALNKRISDDKFLPQEVEGKTVYMNANGIAQEAADFARSPEMLDFVKLEFPVMFNNMPVEGINRMIFPTLQIPARFSKAYMAAKYDKDIPFDAQEFILENGSILISHIDLMSIGDVYSRSQEAQDLAESLHKITTADVRVASIDTYMQNVQQEHIDLQVPSLNDTFNTDWMTKRINISTKDGSMRTRNANINESLQQLITEPHLISNNDNTLFDMSTASRAELKLLRKELLLRKGQKQIIRVILKSDKMLNSMSSFRQTVRKEINDGNMFAPKKKFSQEEVHNYKEHSVISDFLYDYVIDPELLKDINDKQINEEPLLKEEKEYLKRLEHYINTLMVDEAVAAQDKSEGFIKHITTYENLRRAGDLLDEYKFNEQALEIIDGVEYLLEEFPIAGNKDGITKEIDMRRSRVTTTLTAFARDGFFLNKALTVYSQNDKIEAPKWLTELFTLAQSIESEGDLQIKTNEALVVAEKLIHKFYKSLPDIKDEIGESDFMDSLNSTIGNEASGNTMGGFILLLSDYNADIFYDKYMNILGDNATEDTQVAERVQEMSALYVNAFLSKDKAVIIDNSKRKNYFLAIPGGAGTGKTHMVAKLGLGVAQSTSKFKTPNKILYAANFKEQIENLGESLKDVETLDEGYDRAKLFDLLRRYTKGDKTAKNILDSLLTIVYDEVTLIDSRLTSGENSMNEFYALMEKVNEMRSEYDVPLHDLKVIVMGDDSQIGFTDSTITTEKSSMTTWINKNGQLLSFELQHSFRAGNPFLEKGVNSIRHMATTITMGSASKPLTVSWGKQKAYGDKYMGVNIKPGKKGMFNEMLEDTGLRDNIKKQLDADPKFTVAIIHSKNTTVTDSAVADLAKTYSGRVRIISEGKVQGREFNYIITEWDPDSIGDYSITDDKGRIVEHMYTLASRAKDYALILNSNNAKVISNQVDDTIILPTNDESLENKATLFDHVKKVYSELDPVSEEDKAKVEAKRKVDEAAMQKWDAEYGDLSNQALDVEEELKNHRAIDINTITKENLSNHYQAELDLQEKLNTILSTKKALGKKIQAMEKQTGIKSTVDIQLDDNIETEENVNVLLKDITYSERHEAEVAALEKTILDTKFNDIVIDLASVKNAFRFLLTLESVELNSDDITEAQEFVDDPEMLKAFEHAKKTMVEMANKALKVAESEIKNIYGTVERVSTIVEATYINNKTFLTEANINDKIIKEKILEELEESGVNVEHSAVDEVINEVASDITIKLADFLKAKNNGTDGKKGDTKKNMDKEEFIENSEKDTNKYLNEEIYSDSDIQDAFSTLMSGYNYDLGKLDTFLTKIKETLNINKKVSVRDRKKYNDVVDLLDAIDLRDVSVSLSKGGSTHTIPNGKGMLKNVGKDKLNNITILKDGITAAEVYNMQQSQLNADTGLISQVYSLREDGENSQDKNTERSIAQEIIVNGGEYSTEQLDFSQRAVNSVVNNPSKISNLKFIGGVHTSYGYYNPNAYVVAEFRLNPNSTPVAVVLGKIFLGFPVTKTDTDGNLMRSKADQIVDSKDDLNKQLGLTGANMIVEADRELENEEGLFRKVYPTANRLREKIKFEGTNGISIDIKTNYPNFIEKFNLGAGRPTFNDSAKITIAELRKKLEDRYAEEGFSGGKVRISKHVFINMGEPFKGVPRGGAFTLYTASDNIKIDDEQTDQAIMDNKQFYGTGNFITSDVGIIALSDGNVSLEQMYDKILPAKNRDYDAKPLSDQNTALNGASVNIKIAKILTNLMKFMGKPENKHLLNKIYPSGTKVADSEWSNALSENITSTAEKLNEEFYTITTKNDGVQVHGNVDDSSIKAFIELLNMDNGKDKTLGTNDVLSSVFIPIMRNFGTSMFRITGGVNYSAKYYAMLSSFRRGTDIIPSFNTYTLIGAIARELESRMRVAKVPLSEIDGKVDKYMKELILPSLAQLISVSDAFKGYAGVYDAGVSLISNKKTTTAIDLRVTTVKKRITSAGTGVKTDFILSRGVDEADYQMSGMTDIVYPALSLQMENVFDELFGGNAKYMNPSVNITIGQPYTSTVNTEPATQEHKVYKAELDSIINDIENIENYESYAALFDRASKLRVSLDNDAELKLAVNAVITSKFDSSLNNIFSLLTVKKNTAKVLRGRDIVNISKYSKGSAKIFQSIKGTTDAEVLSSANKALVDIQDLYNSISNYISDKDTGIALLSEHDANIATINDIVNKPTEVADKKQKQYIRDAETAIESLSKNVKEGNPTATVGSLFNSRLSKIDEGPAKESLKNKYDSIMGKKPIFIAKSSRDFSFSELTTSAKKIMNTLLEIEEFSDIITQIDENSFDLELVENEKAFDTLLNKAAEIAGENVNSYKSVVTALLKKMGDNDTANDAVGCNL